MEHLGIGYWYNDSKTKQQQFTVCLLLMKASSKNQQLLKAEASLNVTGFTKRGLPHTSDLQASTIHNFRCVKAMELQIIQFRALT